MMTGSLTSVLSVMTFVLVCPRYMLWWPVDILLRSASDNVGHLAADCPHFRGAARDPTNLDTAIQPFMGGEYTARLMGRTAEDERVIEITDPDDTKREFVVKRATGEQHNQQADGAILADLDAIGIFRDRCFSAG